MKNDKIKFLVGTEDMSVYPLQPYDALVIEFFNDLAKELRNDRDARKYPDILSFAFWCRKGNLIKLKEEFTTKQLRLGRGLVFHIAPSNVPINFVFSLAFGLLAGNDNVVRVSSKPFAQVDIICKCINNLLNMNQYEGIKHLIKIVSYDRDSSITDYYSGICDARIVWGGDETIREIGKSPLPERAVEIHFADRYSFGIINPQTVLDMEKDELRRLAEQFYNDTYLLDQNACSAPHLILWLGDEALAEKAKNMFWEEVYQVTARYELADIKVSEKYTSLCEFAANGLETRQVKVYGNRLYVAELRNIPKQMCMLKGKYGEFFDCTLKRLDDISPYITPKVQSCMICGIQKEMIQQFIIDNHLKGIDRIVPFGNSLDIGVIWDGYDIISCLSRVIG